MQAFGLEGKVAIVTGALGLLGQEHCAALSAAGATVVATDLGEDERIAGFARRLGRTTGRDVLGLAADLTDPSAVEHLRDATLSAFGHIDVLVNNAAIDDKVVGDAESPRFEDYPLDAFRRQLDVNVTGVFLACQKLGAPMAEAGRGSIVNVASTYGITAPRQDLYRRTDGSQTFFKGPAYPASKAAVLQLTRYLAAYWGPRGVRVNALSPGGVRASQDEAFVAEYAKHTPLGRMARREDYRGAVVFLASDASSYMTGANLVIDGGFTIW